jgi:RNA polymerase sigma-70 factor (ECF subfamily)
MRGDEEQQMMRGTEALAEDSQSPSREAEPASAASPPEPQKTPEPNDSGIEAAIAGGDYRRALSLCVREHGTALGRLCMAMVGSQAEADDLVQETLLTAHDGFAAYRGEGTVRAWLFGIARKKCLHHLEKNRRRENRLRLVHPSERKDTEEVVLLKQRADRARAALEAVKPTEREALVLRYVGQLSFAEVAAACGVDEAAARKRVSRALVRLRSQLSSE